MMIPRTRIFADGARKPATGGDRLPTMETIDGRSAALEKVTQESRTHQDRRQAFVFLLNEVKNESDRKIEVVFWEYRFPRSPHLPIVVRRQFLCGEPVSARAVDGTLRRKHTSAERLISAGASQRAAKKYSTKKC